MAEEDDPSEPIYVSEDYEHSFLASKHEERSVIIIEDDDPSEPCFASEDYEPSIMHSFLASEQEERAVIIIEDDDPSEPCEEYEPSMHSSFMSQHDDDSQPDMCFPSEAGLEDQVLDNVKYDVDGEAWRRGDLIGAGAFGSVYLATLKNQESQQEVIISSFPPLMAVKSADVFEADTLQVEKQVLSLLHKTQTCPYIVQCFGDEYTTGENGENVYNLLLEYASGGSLRDLIRRSRGAGLPESDVRLYTRSILLGMKHVHACGIVHLDIKPDNILLVPCASRSGSIGSTKFMPKICDFGLAKKANRGKSSVRGTAMYLSPEAARDGIQEAPSDVWAIGCLVLELLTAKEVWQKKACWSTDGFIRKIGHKFGMPKIPSGISEEGKEFLNGCFQRKAEDRLTVEMLLELPFVLDLGEEENIKINAEESMQAGVMGEKRSRSSDETIGNHKRRKITSSSDVDGAEGKLLIKPQHLVKAIAPEPYASPLCAAF